ncbi:MAG: hypothetical protein V1835_06865, partial [Candidatus Micrarchaeota archaeon]
MLSKLFGGSALVKVLDFLLDEWETDFSTVEVADEAGLTWKSVAPIMPYLEKQGLIKKTRTIGR